MENNTYNLRKRNASQDPLQDQNTKMVHTSNPQTSQGEDGIIKEIEDEINSPLQPSSLTNPYAQSGSFIQKASCRTSQTKSASKPATVILCARSVTYGYDPHKGPNQAFWLMAKPA